LVDKDDAEETEEACGTLSEEQWLDLLNVPAFQMATSMTPALDPSGGSKTTARYRNSAWRAGSLSARAKDPHFVPVAEPLGTEVRTSSD
jgi:hypothetical protein